MELQDKLKNFLNSEGKLTVYPAKRNMKLLALAYYASKFESGKEYSEKKVNSIINDCSAFIDPATIRRELYTHRFFDRKLDCSAYWLEENQPWADT